MAYDGDVQRFRVEHPALQLLRGARALLTERGWCKHAIARDARGFPCENRTNFLTSGALAEAQEFCTLGSLFYASEIYHVVESVRTGVWRSGASRISTTVDIAVWLMFNGKADRARIARWNDHADRTKEDVLARIDHGIASGEAWIAAFNLQPELNYAV